jgi:uncharacterized protein YegL
MFEGQSPENYEQKCLCVLVVDVSGSMAGEPLDQLNIGLRKFQEEVSADFTASQRLEVSLVTFGSSAQCIQEPALVSNFKMPTLSATGTTKLVDAMRLAMDLSENRKKWYKSTGQKYFRPMIVLITDGEPDSDQDMYGLANEIRDYTNGKKAIFWTIGVKDYNHAKLAQITPPDAPPRPLAGLAFSEFFKWLSDSMGAIVNSKEGQILGLPPTNGWSQIQL